MSKKLDLILAQINTVVGDIAGNSRIILDVWSKAAPEADLIIFPELAVCGYPSEDLILKPSFLDACDAARGKIIAASRDFKPAALVTAPYREKGITYNALYLVEGGAVKATILKHCLPNYGVFDEKRVFTPGPLPMPVNFRGVTLGLMICEDMWYEEVSAHLAKKGADILIAPNSSPYHIQNVKRRREKVQARATENNLPFVYVNQIGGQDELVFDGNSFIVDERGEPVFTCALFQENCYQVRLVQDEEGSWSSPESIITPALDPEEEAYSALMLSLRDYVQKNNFPGVLLGLSGGIDSALVAAIAVDALGVQNVHGVMMPSNYTSRDNVEDARRIARNLGIKLDNIPIKKPVAAFGTALKKFIFGATSVTFENIQPRTRGIILMALSNASGKMVLSTGNKSEIATGYATLYGDMCGGFNPLKDVYKTHVYRLAAWRNQSVPTGALGPRGEIIPARVFTKPPTAELKPDQTDQDTLPPYETLDEILHSLIEDNLDMAGVIAKGHAPETVSRVAKRVYSA
ncbi:MAG: NAD+ synthase [Alphaproteobacteria bacterium]